MNGYRIINRRLGQRPRAKWQTPEIISYLTNPKTLMEWAHLPLSARVVLLEEKFGVKKSIQTLSSLYKKHKIRFIPQYTYCRKERGKAFLSVQ